jgi:hypothetical protein
VVVIILCKGNDFQRKNARMLKMILIAAAKLLLWGAVVAQKPLHRQLAIGSSSWLLLQREHRYLLPTQLAVSTLHPELALGGGVKNTMTANYFLPRFTAEELPIFCKIEHHLGKKMPLLVKFRLGSVEYVDMLEGK